MQGKCPMEAASKRGVCSNLLCTSKLVLGTRQDVSVYRAGGELVRVLLRGCVVEEERQQLLVPHSSTQVHGGVPSLVLTQSISTILQQQSRIEHTVISLS